MAWIRLDSRRRGAVFLGALAAHLELRGRHQNALVTGLYDDTLLGFATYRPDGRADLVLDSTLETWAGWCGKGGAWARAFRAECVSSEGVVEDWYRQAGVFQTQLRDRTKRRALIHHLRGPVFDRDGGKCRYCGRAVSFAANYWEDEPIKAVLDHVIPLVAGGTDEIENLALACWACNASKGGCAPKHLGISHA